MIPRYILLHLGDHALNGSDYRGRVKISLRNGVHGIAHHNGRIGGIENDDRFPALCSANHRKGSGRCLSELVDILPGSWSRGEAGDRTDHLGVAHWSDTAHGVDQRSRCLPTAGNHIDVDLIQMLSEVSGRDDIGASGSRSQVNGDATSCTQGFRVANVGFGTGRIEDDLDLGIFEHCLDATGTGANTERAGAGESHGVGVDASQENQFHMPRLLQEFVHQVAADVA